MKAHLLPVRSLKLPWLSECLEPNHRALPRRCLRFNTPSPFSSASGISDLRISAAYINTLFALYISDPTSPREAFWGSAAGAGDVLYSRRDLGVRAGTSWVGFPTPTQSFRRRLGSTAGVSPLQNEKYMVLPYTSPLRQDQRDILGPEVSAERLAGNKRPALSPCVHWG